MFLRITTAALFVSLAAAGCSDSLDDPPDGNYRFLNAAASLGATSFLVEELGQGTLDYTAATGLTPLDSGPFDFNVETLDPAGSGSIRSLSQPVTITANQDHTYVLYDTGGTLSLEEYTQQATSVDAPDAELTILHAFSGGPPVDVFVEPDGADLAAATPRGTPAFKDMLAPFVIDAGAYRVSVTAAGNPADILFQSTASTFGEASSSLVTLFGSAGGNVAQIQLGVVTGDGAGFSLFDTLTAPVLRTVHAASQSGALDVVIDGNFAQPLHVGVSFREFTDFRAVTSGDRMIQVTPAGNMGVIEIEDTVAFIPARRSTQIINGDPGELVSRVFIDDFRGIASRSKFAARHAGSSVPNVDLYITQPGTDVTSVAPNSTLQAAGPEASASLLPGPFEITLVLNDSDASTVDETIVAGPVAVDFIEQRVYEITILDGATGGMLDITVTDVTAP